MLPADAPEWIPAAPPPVEEVQDTPSLPTLSLSDLAKDEATGVVYLRPGFYLGSHFDLVWKHGAPLCPVYLTFEGEGRNVEGNLPMANAMLDCGLEAASRGAFEALLQFEDNDEEYERQQESVYPWLDPATDTKQLCKLPKVCFGDIELVPDSAMALFTFDASVAPIEQGLQGVAKEAMLAKAQEMVAAAALVASRESRGSSNRGGNSSSSFSSSSSSSSSPRGGGGGGGEGGRGEGRGGFAASTSQPRQQTQQQQQQEQQQQQPQYSDYNYQSHPQQQGQPHHHQQQPYQPNSHYPPQQQQQQPAHAGYPHQYQGGGGYSEQQQQQGGGGWGGGGGPGGYHPHQAPPVPPHHQHHPWNGHVIYPMQGAYPPPTSTPEYAEFYAWLTSPLADGLLYSKMIVSKTYETYAAWRHAGSPLPPPPPHPY